MKAHAIFLVIPLTLFAHENNGRGTKAIGLANAFVAVADNPWAVSYNPAGLAQLITPEFSAFFVPQQFGIPQLRTIALSGACTINPGTAGAFVEQFGFDLYKTTDVGLGYGLAINNSISIGVTTELEQVSIDRYGTSHTLTFNGGLQGKPLPGLSIGFCLTNLSAATISQNRERLPQTMFLGASFSPVEGFTIVSELEKEVEFPLVAKFGVEEEFFGFLSLRCGVADNPDKFSAGIAVRYSEFEFGYAGYSHPDLGWTHQIELTLRWPD